MALSTEKWGLLGPDTLEGMRRTRTLELLAATRYFNECAVPGLGGVWFGKQVLLSTLGVVVAEEARGRGNPCSNIATANAIEALACAMAFKRNDWKTDSRLLGRRKLQNKSDNLSFKHLSKTGVYVTQPMRMATVQALPALGLVSTQGQRFNAFESTQSARDFIETACASCRPYNSPVMSHLVDWAQGGEGIGTDALHNALSPCLPMSSDARRTLRDHLQRAHTVNGEADATRRRNALRWVDLLKSKNQVASSIKPEMIDADHWHDIQAGALFFKAQAQAISALEAVEHGMGPKCSYVDAVQKAQPQLEQLKKAAQAFLETNHQNQDATKFCRECTADDPADILKKLVLRDGIVLRDREEDILRGPAFDVNSSAPSVEDSLPSENAGTDIPLPEGVSFRLRNLYLLNLDLQAELDAWLNSDVQQGVVA